MASDILPSAEINELNWMFDEKGDLDKVNINISNEVFEDGYRYFFVSGIGAEDGEVLMQEFRETDSERVVRVDIEAGQQWYMLRVDEDKLSSEAELFPNPVNNGEFTLYYNVVNDGTAHFQIFDVRGRIIWEEDRELTSGELFHYFSVYGLEKGKYIFKMHFGDAEFSERLVVIQ